MEALIVGGGIAGSATAMALQQAGIRSRIFEAYPAGDAEVGSYLTVTANGLAALGTISALDVATEAGFRTHRNVLWNHAGRRLATIPLDSRLAGSPTARTMKRARFARLLRDEAGQRGIPIEYGRRCVGAEVAADGRVSARFQDGSEAIGDLLIGADGVHSVVRRLIDPVAPAARYVGLTNFGGFTRGAADGIEPETWHLIFGQRAFFGYHATHSGDVVWFANLPRPMVTHVERAATSDEGWKRQLAAVFAHDAGPATELIDAGELELSADNTHDLAHVPIWQRGPLVIIGDAAHAPAPSSGQGASMAAEDAVVLAKALRDERSIGDALAAYERGRRPRVEKIVRWGAQSSSSKTPGAFGRLLRDALLPVALRFLVTDRALAWMYDYRVSWDEPMAERAASPA